MFLSFAVTWSCIGFWHGANWTFVLWGILHGIFSVITRIYKKTFDRLHPALNWIITFVFVNVTWVFFRADTIKEALKLDFYISFAGPITGNIISCFNQIEITFLTSKINQLIYYPNIILLGYFVIAFFLILGSSNAYQKMQTFKPTFLNVTGISLLLIWCLISFTGISTFLYFNF